MNAPSEVVFAIEPVDGVANGVNNHKPLKHSQQDFGGPRARTAATCSLPMSSALLFQSFASCRPSCAVQLVRSARYHTQCAHGQKSQSQCTVAGSHCFAAPLLTPSHWIMMCAQSCGASGLINRTCVLDESVPCLPFRPPNNCQMSGRPYRRWPLTQLDPQLEPIIEPLLEWLYIGPYFVHHIATADCANTTRCWGVNF